MTVTLRDSKLGPFSNPSQENTDLKLIISKDNSLNEIQKSALKTSFTELHIQDQEINEEFWTTICSFHKLESLYMNNCKFKIVPKEINNLIHLKTLSLSNCSVRLLAPEVWDLDLEKVELRNTEVVYLSEEIDKLKNLKELILSQNKIPDLEHINWEKISNLQILELTKLPIKKLPDSINSLVNLESLNLSDTKITNINNLKAKNLKKLDISRTEIVSLPKSLEESPLELLNVMGCKLVHSTLKSLQNKLNLKIQM